jgi:hypothetical protein
MVCYKERVEDDKWIKFTETPTEVTASVEVQFIENVAKEITRNKKLSL